MLCHLCGKLRLRQPALCASISDLYSSWSGFRFLCYHTGSPKCVYGRALTEGLRRHLVRVGMPPRERVKAHSVCTAPSKWEQPEGYNSGIMIYHPVLKKKVPLILRQEKLAQWYACGPTVYDHTHIGHASSYVRQDIIRRIMGSVFDIDTTLVMGVTDVDDKIIVKARETGQDMTKMTRFYESEFFASMANLNVSPPSVVTRVTDHIPHIVDFIINLEKKGLAYKSKDGSVYFDVKQYGKYGVFSGSKKPEKTSEAESHKRNPQDFALWKASKPGEPWWESPWGQGRPGWHIECSAMASGIFGANFDLHTGGEDLIFPHHENELAQSCAYHDNSQWVNYWIHTGHLFLPGQNDKMSKSLKNVISVSEFLEDYTPNHFRMLCLLNNYKKRIEFSEERMQKAVSTMSACNSVIKRCESYVKGQIDCGDIPEVELYEKLHSTRRTIEGAFADDFNTPQALANLMRLVKFTNQLLGEEADKENLETKVRSNAPVAAVAVYVRRLLKQLGLDIGRKKAEEETETHLQFYKAVETVVSSRAKIRDFAKNKKFMIKSAEEVGIPKEQAVTLMKTLYRPLWEASDKIRADILSTANVQISDDTTGSTWGVVDSKKKPKSVRPQDDSREIDMKKLEKDSLNSQNSIADSKKPKDPPDTENKSQISS